MRITRYPSLTEQQFFGCVAAFVDSLTGELNAAAMALRRLEGKPKGSAFAYEMTLDGHRYGAMIVLDRWAAVVAAFGPHLDLAQRRDILATADARIRSAGGILARVNQLIDAASGYDPETVEAAIAGWQSLNTAFRGEREAAEQFAKLGPMLSDDYRSARSIFLEDLAAR